MDLAIETLHEHRLAQTNAKSTKTKTSKVLPSYAKSLDVTRNVILDLDLGTITVIGKQSVLEKIHVAYKKNYVFQRTSLLNTKNRVL